MNTVKNKKSTSKIALTFIISILGNITTMLAAELFIGTATADITPSLPVALTGQFHLRIAKTIETPLTANVIALESKDGEHPPDVAIMVSCDVLDIPTDVLMMLRDEVKKQIPGLDVMKIFLNATHTHTAPVMENDINSPFRYAIPNERILQVNEYNRLFIKSICKAIIKAWENRKPCNVGWGMSHAAIAYNRRAVYANGSAVMYGNTNTPEFRNGRSAPCSFDME